MGAKLYVGNLNFKTTEDTLRDAFSANGRTVKSVLMPSDRETGRPRGFAFVEMGSEAEAQAAIQDMDGVELDGRPLRVNEAQERQGSGGGGGGGGGRGLCRPPGAARGRAPPTHASLRVPGAGTASKPGLNFPGAGRGSFVPPRSSPQGDRSTLLKLAGDRTDDPRLEAAA